MAASGRAAKARDKATSGVDAITSNQYVKRLVDDADLRANLRSAYDSARTAYSRMQNGKGPARAIFEDKKVQKNLREASDSLKSAADALRKPQKKRRRRFGVAGAVGAGVVGAGLALVASEGLRKKVLDTLFGAEEEFEYSTGPTSAPAAAPAPAPAAPAPAATSEPAAASPGGSDGSSE